mmetsp:Transcript_10595/g.43232  ORF Transcript_10595/g.43232 Transcript_10595/m.43232 type:complete len:374 (-) Transcript_10595:2006-3127(-)
MQAQHLAAVIADLGLEVARQGPRRFLPQGEGLQLGRRLRHVQRQRQLAQRQGFGVLGQSGLGIELQGQHRRRTLVRRRQHEAAGQRTGDKAMPRRGLLHKARRPGGAPGAQQQRELGIVAGGELVQLAGARDHIEHVGELHKAADAVGESLDLLHELRVLDLVERAAAVGHFQAGLELAVALPRRGQLPLAGLGMQALDLQRLGTGAAAAGLVLQRQLAGHRMLDRDRRNRVDQRVDARRRAPQRAGYRGQAHRKWLGLGGRIAGHRRRVEMRLLHAQRVGTPGACLARRPGAMGHHARQHHAAGHREKLGQGHTHASSAIARALSMSTATIRDTPCSCIVTPISCSAISIAILLCEMKRNWVTRLICETSLA